MNKEETIKLAKKVSEGKADSKEIDVFLNELEEKITDLDDYINSLSKKK